MWLWSLALLGCDPDRQESAREASPSETNHRPATRALIEIALTPPSRATGLEDPPRSGFRWEAEVIGLATALVESGLTELPDVAAAVAGVAPAPGIASALRTGAARWTAALTMDEDPALLRFRLTLCDPTARCLAQQATGSRDDVVAPITDLLVWAARVLQRPPRAEVWGAPISPDPYAVLVCGRSAAVFYGVLPPVAPERIGDRSADPIAKAVWLDPGMGLAEWVLGRREAARGEWASARVAFTSATLGRPGSNGFLADEAAALAAAGKAEAATVAWAALYEMAPADPRYPLALARAATDSDQPTLAAGVVASLAPRFLDEPEVVELAVRIADATGPSADYDDLLARWAEAYPLEPEPVRRRVALRVRDGRLQEAWDLLPELAHRGAVSEAARARMAIGVGLGRYEEAASAAEEVGEPEAAARILVRRALHLEPDRMPHGLGALGGPRARQLEAEILMRAGDARSALTAADLALEEAPWLPEALAIRAAALAALGRAGEAAEAERLMVLSDPAMRRHGVQ